MMKDNKVYAVITGDIVDSTKLDSTEREVLFKILKNTFSVIKKIEKDTSFKVFRGDSFQGISASPQRALGYAIMIRAALRTIEQDSLENMWDARIAVGIGMVEFPDKEILKADGEAFRNSGRMLSKMKSDERILVKTPWKSVNEEFDVACALSDGIIKKWSSSQAQVIVKQIAGMNQTEIAEELKISQAAIHYRLKAANWDAINKFLKRYQTVINQNV